ncbi:hypothetical protein ACFPYI_09320 [Halomarina salina]|uniref:HVO-0234-like beta-propeller domain-containing protein n=1 Tax=Halomarina salina TaxID=1872699 RepID=A0ABD5RMK6_9EURY|nr:hypothetical protein [Halomarina salina]
MSTIDEKRVYGERSGATEAFVATGMGLARVSVSGDLVGEFGLADRRPVRDVAARDGTLAVACDEDVLVGATLDETGFGPADAVGFDRSGDLLAAGEGRVARYTVDDDAGSETWTTLGECEDVRAVDGDLVATADGVFRVTDDGLSHAGLDDARDVTIRPVPRVATADGLYQLGNGWMDDGEGSFSVVASDGDRTHAATDDALLELLDGEWATVDLPVSERVAGVAYADQCYAVTEAGTFLVEGEREDDGDDEASERSAEREWHSRTLGLPDVRGVAVP